MGLLLPYFLNTLSAYHTANWVVIGLRYLQLVQLFGIAVLAANRFTFALFSKLIYSRLWTTWALFGVLVATFLVPIALIAPRLYIEAYYFPIEGPAAVIHDGLTDGDNSAIRWERTKMLSSY